MDNSCTLFGFSIEISMDEIKLVVTEKRKFECRHESRFIAFYRFSQIIKNARQGQISTISQGTRLRLVENFQKKLMEENEEVVTEKIRN